MDDSGGNVCSLSVSEDKSVLESDASPPEQAPKKIQRRNRSAVFDVRIRVPDCLRKEWRDLEIYVGTNDPEKIMFWLVESTAKEVGCGLKERLLKDRRRQRRDHSDDALGLPVRSFNGRGIAVLRKSKTEDLPCDYEGAESGTHVRSLTSRKVQKMADPENEQTSIGMLPDEVLGDILLRVSMASGNKALKCAEVCKHWDLIARTSMARVEMVKMPSFSRAVQQVGKFEWLRCIRLEEGSAGVRGWQPIVEVFSERLRNLSEIHILSVQPRLSSTDAATLFANRSVLKVLQVHGSLGGSDAPWLQNMTSLEKLDLTGSSNLTSLPSLHRLARLNSLTLNDCPKLAVVPGLDSLTQLRSLHMEGCSLLMSRSSPPKFLYSLSLLESLSICSPADDTESQDPSLPFPPMMRNLMLSSNSPHPPRLNPLPLLHQFSLTHSHQARILPSLVGIAGSLASITISDCQSLTNITPLLPLRTLKRLHIKNCPNLETLPSFDGLTEFQELSVTKCLGLHELSPINGLPHLSSLNFSFCRELKTLPALRNLPSLQEIHLSECTSLKTLPPINHITSLRSIDLSHCASVEHLPDLNGLSGLEVLNVSSCVSLGTIPSLGALRGLRVLDAANCSIRAVVRARPDDILSSVAQLTGLQNFILSPISPDPIPLRPIPSLQNITFVNVHNALHLPRLAEFTSMLSITISDCNSLTTVTPIGSLRSLQKLCIGKCRGLRSLPNLSALTDLVELSLSWCPEVEELPVMCGLPNLKSIVVEGCGKLTIIPCLTALPSLETVEVSDCSSLKGLPNLDGLSSLRKLIISWCRSLQHLPALNKVTMLEELALTACAVSSLPKLDKLQKLRTLAVLQCMSLYELPDLGGLSSLEVITASQCEALRCIPSFESVPRLREVYVSNAIRLGKTGPYVQVNYLRT